MLTVFSCTSYQNFQSQMVQALFGLACVILIFSSPALTSAQESPLNDLLSTKPAGLADVSSQEAAFAFFVAHVNPHLEFFTPRELKQPVEQLPAESTSQIERFVAYLALWHDVDIQHLWSEHGWQNFERTLPPSTPHTTWIAKVTNHSGFTSALSMLDVIIQLRKQSGYVPGTLPDLSEVAAYFDQQQSQPAKNDTISWEHIAETEGASGILSRLQTYPGPSPAPASGTVSAHAPEPTYQLHPLTILYLRERVLPSLEGRFWKDALFLKTKAQWELMQLWQDLSMTNEQRKKTKALQRLCGTWQWTLHNHQNHKDHKTVLTFPPPSEIGQMTPAPAQIEIWGNTVYLEWKYAGGSQEDSLLLGNQDQLLEGTFTSSAGPYGNISGRKIRSCSTQPPR